MASNSTDYCIYDNDPDGWCSAHIVFKKYGNRFKYTPIKRSKLYPNVNKGNELIILDISSNINVDFISKFNKIIWIDHHKTTKDFFESLDKDIKSKIKFVWDTSVSTCYLTFKYLYPNKPIPKYIELTSDFDSGRNMYKDSNYLISYIELHSSDFKRPDSPKWRLLEDEKSLNTIIENGKEISVVLLKKDNAIIRDRGFYREIDGVSFICVNHKFDDRIVDILKRSGLKFSILCFVYEKNKWVVTLYSSFDDMSVIAKKYGGGGHKYAAGFTCSTSELINILNLT